MSAPNVISLQKYRGCLVGSLVLPHYYQSSPVLRAENYDPSEAVNPLPFAKHDCDPPLANVPAELREFTSWVMWKFVERDGRRTKPPCDFRTGRIAGADNENVYLSFEAAKACLDFGGCDDFNPHRFDGIGLVLKPEYGLIGYDADHCIDADGKINPVAQSDIDAWNTYAEISPSGEGIRMFAFGEKPGDRDKSGGFELYDGSSTRYLTVTGDMISQAASVNTPAKGVIEATYTRMFGEAHPPGDRAEEPATGGFPEGKEDLPAVDKYTAKFEDLETEKALKRKLGDEKFAKLWEELGGDGDSERNLALATHVIYLLKEELKPLHRKAQIDLVERVIRKALDTFKEYGKMSSSAEFEVPGVTLVTPLCQRFLELPKIVELNLMNYKDVLYRFDRCGYVALNKTWGQNQLTRFLPLCWAYDKEGNRINANPTRTLVISVNGVLMAETDRGHYDEIVPFWRNPEEAFTDEAPSKLIVFQNGLLSMNEREFYAPTQNLFVLNPLPFDYDPDAAEPKRWLQFLDEIWCDDPKSRDLLQEVFGYLISGETDQQKIFLLIGAKRGGKGTVGRVIETILGKSAVSGAPLSACSVRFGLSSIIDKRLWLVADARLGSKQDKATILEKLLLISGEDHLDIDRKHIDAWSGTLGARVMIMSNEMPAFYDPSGAMKSRLIPLRFRISFEGKEDRGLGDALAAEASGIINWSLEGLKRLRKNGRFTETADALEMKEDFDELADPMFGFVGDVIEEEPEGELLSDDAFEAWKQYSEDHDIRVAQTKPMFGKTLKSRLPAIELKRNRIRTVNGEKKKVDIYIGVKFVDGAEPTAFAEFIG
jgi:P4 family phage/plasmid primase-like protien